MSDKVFKIGTKEISLKKALKYYSNKQMCCARFNLSDKEYDVLLVLLISEIKKSGKSTGKDKSKDIKSVYKKEPIKSPIAVDEWEKTTHFSESSQRPTWWAESCTFKNKGVQKQIMHSSPANNILCDRQFFTGKDMQIATPIRMTEPTRTISQKGDIFQRQMDITKNLAPVIDRTMSFTRGV